MTYGRWKPETATKWMKEREPCTECGATFSVQACEHEHDQGGCIYTLEIITPPKRGARPLPYVGCTRHALRRLAEHTKYHISTSSAWPLTEPHAGNWRMVVIELVSVRGTYAQLEALLLKREAHHIAKLKGRCLNRNGNSWNSAGLPRGQYHVPGFELPHGVTKGIGDYRHRLANWRYYHSSDNPNAAKNYTHRRVHWHDYYPKNRERVLERQAEKRGTKRKREEDEEKR